MKWYKIEDQLPDEEFVMPVKVDGKKLCMIRHAQQLYAVQNTCPHAGGILSGGWCKNGYLICPIHRWEYSLINGRGAVGQGDYIDTYPVEERPDGLYIGLKEPFWKKIFG